MTHITCTFSSVSMETDVTFHLLLPSARNGLLPCEEPWIPEGGFPVLYLLHGIGDSAESWLWHSGIGALCDKYRLAAVIPSCGNSFYLDSPDGVKAFSYITAELLDYTRNVFPLSQKRESTFLCGYSMGGYGAVRIGLLRPDLFGKIVSLSGALDIRHGGSFARICGYSVPDCLKKGRETAGTDRDIFFCLSQADPEKESFPEFYIACGTEDNFHTHAEKFCRQASAAGIHTVLDLTPGEHNWDVWNPSLSRAVQWICRDHLR